MLRPRWSMILALCMSCCAAVAGRDGRAADPPGVPVERLVRLRAAGTAVLLEMERLRGPAEEAVVKAATDELLADPQRHASVSQSRQLLRASVEQLLRSQIDACVAREVAAKGAGVQPPITSAELRAWLDRAAGGFDARVGQTLDRFFADHFEASCLQPARKVAVDAEFRRLQTEFPRPDFEVLDSLLKQDPEFAHHRPRLEADLRGRNPSQPVFEENIKKCRDQVAAILDQIDVEYQTQQRQAREAIDKTRDYDAVAIVAAAEVELRRARDAIPNAGPLFTTIRARLLPKLASEAQAKRLEELVLRGKFPLDAGWMRAEIERQLGLHLQLAPSRQRLLEAAAGAARERWAAQAAASWSGLPEFQAAQARLAAALAEPQNKNHCERRVTEWVDATLAGVRRELASRQMAALFPTAEHWSPSPEQVSALYGKPLPRDARELVQLVQLQLPETRDVLDETWELLAASARSTLVSHINAQRDQLEVVERYSADPAVVRDLTADALRGRPKSEIIARWIAAVGEQWRDRPGASVLRDLYPRTRRAVEEAVSLHFNAIAQRPLPPSSPASVSSAPPVGRTLQAVATPTTDLGSRSGGAGGGSGGGGGGGGGASGEGASSSENSEGGARPTSDLVGEGPPPDVVVVFDQVRSGEVACSVRSLLPGASFTLDSFVFEAGDIEAAADVFVQRVWPALQQLAEVKKRQAKVGATPEVGFAIRIRSRDLRSAFTVQVHQALGQRLRAVGVKLRWGEGL